MFDFPFNFLYLFKVLLTFSLPLLSSSPKSVNYISFFFFFLIVLYIYVCMYICVYIYIKDVPILAPFPSLSSPVALAGHGVAVVALVAGQ